MLYSSFISACPNMRVAEKKLGELPKNAGVHFLIFVMQILKPGFHILIGLWL